MSELYLAGFSHVSHNEIEPSVLNSLCVPIVTHVFWENGLEVCFLCSNVLHHIGLLVT